MIRLAEIVMQCICFLEFSDDTQVDSRAAVKQLESIMSILLEASPDERAAVSDAASTLLASLLREPDEYGYSPRKTVSTEQRKFLESFASGAYWKNYSSDT